MAAGLKNLPKLAIANEADRIKVLQRKMKYGLVIIVNLREYCLNVFLSTVLRTFMENVVGMSSKPLNYGHHQLANDKQL